jgi:hypothetical protein
MTETTATIRSYYLGPRLKAAEAAAQITPAAPAKGADTYARLRTEWGARMDALASARAADKRTIASLQAQVTDLLTPPDAAEPEPAADPDPVASPTVIIPAPQDDPDKAQAYKLGRGELFDRTLGVTGGEGLKLINLKANPNAIPKGSRFLDENTLFLDGPPTPSGEFPLSGFDTSGLKIYWTSPFPVRMDGGRIATNPQRPDVPLVYQGPPSDDARLILKNVTVDQWADVVYPYRQLGMWWPPNIDVENTRFVRTACQIGNFGPGTKASFRNIYFESCGQNPYIGQGALHNDGTPWPDVHDDGGATNKWSAFDHPESWHHAGGQVTIDGFIADYRFKPFYGTGVALHQWRLDPRFGPGPGDVHPDGLALYKNGFVLMGQGGMYYAIQLFKGSNFPGKTRLENIAWRQVGTSATHPGNNQLIDDQNNERLSGRDNINFDTGLLLPGRINADV